jgi:uncharacterized lipoprotein YddW (UPF0748 family)
MVRKSSIDRMLQFANENGFNHIFAQVRGRGDAYYNSEFVSKSHLVDDDFDPLKYLINSNSNKNIKIHAWINIYYLWSSKYPPTQNDHILLNKPEWIDRKVNDKYIKDKSFLNNNEELVVDGEGFYLAPTNPNVNAYLINVVDELSKMYQLDGIHYDYIRFQNLNYGYNEIGLSSFKKSNKVDYVVNTDVAFSEFKRNSITKFVKKAKQKIKLNSPNLIISAALKANIYDAKLLFFQEWDLWLSAGYLDWAVPMNYIVENDKFVQNIYMIKDNLPFKYHEKIIVGISTYNQSPKSAGKKIERLRKMSFNNISIFSYTEFLKNPSYWKKLRKYF